jgi:hypothetical protein
MQPTTLLQVADFQAFDEHNRPEEQNENRIPSQTLTTIRLDARVNQALQPFLECSLPALETGCSRLLRLRTLLTLKMASCNTTGLFFGLHARFSTYLSDSAPTCIKLKACYKL